MSRPVQSRPFLAAIHSACSSLHSGFRWHRRCRVSRPHFSTIRQPTSQRYRPPLIPALPTMTHAPSRS
ncbi:hypothetical protein BCR44DRAFT_40032, partial [Catenaria anguillulae PL171]